MSDSEAEIKEEAEIKQEDIVPKIENSSQKNSVVKRKNDVKTEDLENQNKLKKKVKTEEQSEEDSEQEDLIKFKYLEHNGMQFPKPYQRHHVKPLYDKKPVELTNYQEEMATYWSQTIGTVWQDQEAYRKNFKSQFLKLFSKDYQNFKLFDFTPIKDHIEKERDLRKNRTKEEKEKEKFARDNFFGNAIVDGRKEKINGSMIEPPTLFRGRGSHPKAGMMKSRIMPERLTLNMSEDAPVPRAPVPGHCWGEIVHKYEVTWLGSYKDNAVVSLHKYIFLSATSKFKSQNDLKKYEKARTLKNCIDSIRKDYQKKWNSLEEKDRQLGTAAYLIDKLALRVGNEKGEDEADTVGCCSLRVEHISLQSDNHEITFDFLGKDSMRYFNTVQIDPIVWKNIKSFMKGKKPNKDLFDRIDASVMNDYLRTLMPKLTAKVFRTYNASHTLQQQLNNTPKNLKNEDNKEKKKFYDECVKQVAILCNHQKTANKNFDVQMDKQKEKIQIMEDYQAELEDHIKKFSKKSNVEAYEDRIVLEEKPDGKNKEFIKQFPETKDKSEKRLQKLIGQIKDERFKESNKDIALGTSKTNYNDPRISVAWGKSHEVPIDKIFSKTLSDKFLWAMNIEPDWEF